MICSLTLSIRKIHNPVFIEVFFLEGNIISRDLFPNINIFKNYDGSVNSRIDRNQVMEGQKNGEGVLFSFQLKPFIFFRCDLCYMGALHYHDGKPESWKWSNRALLSLK